MAHKINHGIEADAEDDAGDDVLNDSVDEFGASTRGFIPPNNPALADFMANLDSKGRGVLRLRDGSKMPLGNKGSDAKQVADDLTEDYLGSVREQKEDEELHPGHRPLFEKHQAAIDAVVAATPVRIGDPDEAAKVEVRRAAIEAVGAKPTKGDDEECDQRDAEFEPPESTEDYAPRAATGFATVKTGRGQQQPAGKPAGLHTPDRIASAFSPLVTKAKERAFLADLKTMFNDSRAIKTVDLTTAMAVTASELAALLAPHGVKSRVIRFGAVTAHGYRKADFEPAWRRPAVW